MAGQMEAVVTGSYRMSACRGVTRTWLSAPGGEIAVAADTSRLEPAVERGSTVERYGRPAPERPLEAALARDDAQGSSAGRALDAGPLRDRRRTG